MKLAFDTNVLIDAITENGNYRNAQALMLAVAEERVDGVISANCITDICYILRKRIGDARARDAIWNLMGVFEIAEINGETCAAALGLPMKDFEDAVLAVCASETGAEYIVTSDQEFIASKDVPVTVLSIDDMIEMI